MKNDGGPAFPRPSVNSGEIGMSLRDWFAGMALCGWYTNSGGLPNTDHLKLYAEHFYKMADAMLAERDKKD